MTSDEGTARDQFVQPAGHKICVDTFHDPLCDTTLQLHWLTPKYTKHSQGTVVSGPIRHIHFSSTNKSLVMGNYHYISFLFNFFYFYKKNRVQIGLIAQKE